ncbi:MAG: efflux RND transporter permease subunit, partial [Pseudomonadales bacterium]|nr:efflux RND transporter permease subunit [Pseudomonadales bacterium]
MEKYIEFWINNKFFVLLFIIFIVLGGLLVAPFDWRSQFIERYPIAVDAIPDISENQQIVFTQWPGRSPADVDDQISYPLTVSLLGLPGVKTIRSYSNFGFSMIYVIFEENIEFYWSRSRILEKLNSLPPGSLPQDAIPSLGPDATALGQVFWYTLESRDKQGNPAGGWDLEELRSIQDWNVKYSLMSAAGVSEVASVGGFIREYQIDVNPDAMRAYGVSIQQVFDSILMSSSDVSARTIEVNNVEYMIRGVGFIDKIEDLETIAVTSRNNTPVRIQDLAHITLGPALRRGVLDKGGAEAVGGVAVVRYGDNPLEVISNIKEKIALIAPGLPEKTLEDGTLSKVTIVPFYDRTELIYETLNTLNDAISQQILITLIVILFLVFNLRTSFIIGLMLPLTVFLTFLLMKFFNVDANIVALSGIAIAVGTIVDMGIVFCENILRHYKEHPHTKDTRKLVSKASLEVASAVLTAALTTIVSFIPVFTMTGAEGKLFTPLAFTKTFALISAIILAITLLPAVAHLVYGRAGRVKLYQGLAIVLALLVAFFFLAFNEILFGCLIAALALITIFEKQLQRLFSSKFKNAPPKIFNLVILFITISLLSRHWEPLGPEYSTYINWIFVVCLLAVIFLFILFFQRYYSPMLAGCITHPKLTLSASAMIVAFGFLCWQGYSGNNPWLARSFPGLGKEFMPALDEGAFLYMPTTMPHAGVSEVTDVLHKQNSALSAIPEVENVVGKLGRADSALDSAPISMIETIINYHPEYAPGQETQRGLFQYDEIKNTYLRDHLGNLIEDPEGRPYRNWRPHIKNPDDIWQEIVKVAQIPGTTSAPKLQPIETRIVMLQSGFRAPMGIKVFGPDLDSIERFSQDLEQQLKQVSTIKPETVFAERIVGKPYLEIHINRERISRYGIQLKSVQNVIEVAIGGKQITTTVEGRERYPIRVRYMRELRDSIESLGDILIASPDGVQIPLRELAEIKY